MNSTLVNAQEILEIESKHSSGTYAKQPLVIGRLTQNIEEKVNFVDGHRRKDEQGIR